MIIYKETEEVLADIAVDDNSYRYRAVKGANEICLNFSLAEPIEIPLGSYIEYEGMRYSLEEPPTITTRAIRNITYKAVFSAPQATLNRYRFRNTVDGRLKFCLTARPHEHLQMLIDNLNLRDSGKGWTAGDCIDEVEKVVTYDYSTCLEALDMIAEAFDTEWEVQNKQISLKKVEYFKDSPLPLSYGKGNGFVSGVGRQNRSDEDSGIEILFAFGGDRNVIPEQNTGGEKTSSKYPSIKPVAVNPPISVVAPVGPMQAASAQTAAAAVAVAATDGVAKGNTNLILPRNQELEYEGEVYATDEQGYYIYKKNQPLTTRKEGVLDCSEIYPSRVGTISDVIEVDEDKHFYDFKDSSIPANLNYEDCLIDGEKMTVIFQDGMLAGKEFDVKYKHSERRFEIVPQEIDGITMPDKSTGFVPVKGGKYAVFNVKLPDAYVCDNATKSGASWDLFRKAAEYLHDHADYLFTFSGTLDGIWAKKHWAEIRERLVLGGTILFSDNHFQPDGVKIRITGIKDYLNDPHRPELELSNETVGQSYAGRIAQLEAEKVANEENSKANRQYTKRTFSDAKETMQMLQNSLDTFRGEFTEGISPITVNTMQMLVGSEQCQFEFVNDAGNVIDPVLTYDKDKQKLSIKACKLRYLYGETMAPSPSLIDSSVYAGTSGKLEKDMPYYVYLRGVVNTAGTTSVLYLFVSADAMDFNVDGYRYLLMGILDKDVYGNRSWCPMYGFTEITPGRIRVNKIVSSDGYTAFDLAKGEIKGRINFTDGLISGIIGVAGDSGQINAGMSGEGTAADAVRFWAGASEANRDNAPYRVQQDGTVYLNKAVIGESSTIKGFLYNMVVRLNKDNWNGFVDNIVFDKNRFNLRRFGGNIIFEDDIALQNVDILLDSESITDYMKNPDRENNIFIKFIGNSIDFLGKIMQIRKAKTTTNPIKITKDNNNSISDPNLFLLFLQCGFEKNKNDEECITWNILRGFDKDGNLLQGYSG